MSKRDLILIGGGGHCKACIDVIVSGKSFNVVGIVDHRDKKNQKILGHQILWEDSEIPSQVNEEREFFITLGSIKDPTRRVKLFEYLLELKSKVATIVSPSAHLSEFSAIGEGTVLMHRVMVGPDVNVGKNCIINSAAILEHDVKIGDHTHVSTGSVVNGRCIVGDRVFIGSNSVVSHNIEIVSDVVIGAGSVVTKSITSSGVYVGSPVRKVSEKTII